MWLESSGATLEADLHLDTSGLICPEPLMLVRNRVREMTAGQVLHVVATDPSTGRDFHNFCRFMGHHMLAQYEQDGRFEYWIRKA
jgi:tRNA 2-thiouridine synthesizing protein A